MNKSLVAIIFLGFVTFSCGSEALETENAELKSKVAQLEKDLKASQYEAEEQRKLATFNKNEADTARARADELQKNCK